MEFKTIKQLRKTEETNMMLEDGYLLALNIFSKLIDKKIIEFNKIKSKIPEKFRDVETTEKNQELRLNASLAILEELKTRING